MRALTTFNKCFLSTMLFCSSVLTQKFGVFIVIIVYLYYISIFI